MKTTIQIILACLIGLILGTIAKAQSSEDITCGNPDHGNEPPIVEFTIGKSRNIKKTHIVHSFNRYRRPISQRFLCKKSISVNRVQSSTESREIRTYAIYRCVDNDQNTNLVLTIEIELATGFAWATYSDDVSNPYSVECKPRRFGPRGLRR